MKRYLFASVLSFGLLVATSQFAFAQDDADDEDVEEVEETEEDEDGLTLPEPCLLYTSPSPRDGLLSRMPSSA